MLSSPSQCQLVSIYRVGFSSIFLTGCIIMLFFYHHIICVNRLLEKQKVSLLLEQANSMVVQNRHQTRLLSTMGACFNHDLLRQKIVFWINQSQAHLIDLRFGDGITVSAVGSFSQDLALLIALANTHLVFNIRAIDLFVVQQGIELRVILTAEKRCE